MNRFLRRSTSSRSTAREPCQQWFIVYTVHSHARGRDNTAGARSNARTVGALGNVVQDRAGSVAHLVGLEQRSAATRGSGVLSPKLSVRSGRLVSRRLPLTLALALERVLVGSKSWSSHLSIRQVEEACTERRGRKRSGNTDSISRRWFNPGMDKETCLPVGVSLCLLSYRMAPHRFTLACQSAEALGLLGTYWPSYCVGVQRTSCTLIWCMQVCVESLQDMLHNFTGIYDLDYAALPFNLSGCL